MIFSEPNPNEQVEKDIVVRGLARVFGDGFTYEFTINLDNAPDDIYKIVLYENSAKDGTIVNQLIIPIQVGK